MSVTGLLLTGGSSRRLGVDKARLSFGGGTLADRAAAELAAVCNPAWEAGAGVTRLPLLPEGTPGSGPLAPLAVAGGTLRAMSFPPSVLLFAVDLPRVDRALLGLVARWDGGPTAIPIADGEPQTVCARYGDDALATAARLVEGGERSLRALLDAVEWEPIPEERWRAVAPAGAFVDVDTPADAAHHGIDLGGIEVSGQDPAGTVLS